MTFAPGVGSFPSARSLKPRRRLKYAWCFPLMVFAVTRAVDAMFIVVAGRHQTALATPEPGYHLAVATGADPGYAAVASSWDGQWYRLIATGGYPSRLPVDSHGVVLANEWAFYPLYPFTAGLISRVVDAGNALVAPSLSLVVGGLAAVALYHLIAGTLTRFAASATVTLMCCSMAAPAMQMAYTESLALLLVCLSLISLRSHRYAGFAVSALALALCRPIALVLVPVVSAHWLNRYQQRATRDFGRAERWRVAMLLPWCVAVTGLWPAVAALVTGDPNAYIRTMSAWKAYDSSVPVVGWLLAFRGAFGVVGLLMCAIAATIVMCLVLRPAARAWGIEVRTWAWAYPAYLFTATAPGPSIIRYLLLAFPLLWPVPDLLSSPWSARLQRLSLPLLAVGGLLLQWVWISHFVVISELPVGGLFP